MMTQQDQTYDEGRIAELLNQLPMSEGLEALATELWGILAVLDRVNELHLSIESLWVGGDPTRTLNMLSVVRAGEVQVEQMIYHDGMLHDVLGVVRVDAIGKIGLRIDCGNIRVNVDTAVWTPSKADETDEVYICMTTLPSEGDRKCGTVVTVGDTSHEHGCPVEGGMCGARDCNEMGGCQI